MRRMPWVFVVSMMLLATAGAAGAADIPIVGYKLIVTDKMLSVGYAKVVFVSKDPAITYGAGTGPEQIEASLGIAYDSFSGAFQMPQGANWIVNNGAIAKYVNKPAPAGGAVKVGVFKPAGVVKVSAKSLGETPLDVSVAPSGVVYVAATVVNGAETTRLCTQFTGCFHKVLSGPSYRLICKGPGSTGDAACTAAP